MGHLEGGTYAHLGRGGLVHVGVPLEARGHPGGHLPPRAVPGPESLRSEPHRVPWGRGVEGARYPTMETAPPLPPMTLRGEAEGKGHRWGVGGEGVIGRGDMGHKPFKKKTALTTGVIGPGLGPV